MLGDLARDTHVIGQRVPKNVRAWVGGMSGWERQGAQMITTECVREQTGAFRSREADL